MCNACTARDKHMLAPTTADASLWKDRFFFLSNSSWSLFQIQRTQNNNNNRTFHPFLQPQGIEQMKTTIAYEHMAIRNLFCTNKQILFFNNTL